jgi:hypothetical protein
MECETGASLKEAMFSYDPCFRLQSRARSASRSACANEQLGEVAGLRRKPHGEVQEAPSIAVTADIADILPQPAKIAPSGDPVRRDRTSQTSKQTTLPKARRAAKRRRYSVPASGQLRQCVFGGFEGR